jgi:uncharacterized repeat protein (TIGR03803 family)
VILAFGNFPNGATPYGTPILDSSGNLYGTTYQGGTANLGVVFKLGASGYQVLYNFMGKRRGQSLCRRHARFDRQPLRHHLQWRSGERGRGLQGESVGTRAGDGPFGNLSGARNRAPLDTFARMKLDSAS